MTAKEILEKYGLKTDVKSVKERLRPQENKPFSYSQFLIKWLGGTTQIDKDFLYAWNDIKNADLDLLCEMAERVEKVEELLDLYRKLNDLLELYYTSDSLCEKIGLVGRISDLRDEISEFEEELK